MPLSDEDLPNKEVADMDGVGPNDGENESEVIEEALEGKKAK